MSLEADKSATEAELKHNFTLLAKPNIFRLKVRESKDNEKSFVTSTCFEKKLKLME